MAFALMGDVLICSYINNLRDYRADTGRYGHRTNALITHTYNQPHSWLFTWSYIVKRYSQ